MRLRARHRRVAPAASAGRSSDPGPRPDHPSKASRALPAGLFFVLLDGPRAWEGRQALVEAANGFLGDQLLFGSSYPFRPIAQTVDDFLALGFKPSVLDRVLHGNAARLLKLG